MEEAGGAGGAEGAEGVESEAAGPGAVDAVDAVEVVAVFGAVMESMAPGSAAAGVPVEKVAEETTTPRAGAGGLGEPGESSSLSLSSNIPFR